MRPGFTKHPKLLRLAHELQIPVAHAIGICEMLWAVAYEAGRADIGDDVDVELACGWTGDRGVLCKALAGCGGKGRAGLIEPVPESEGRWQIHDLMDHAPEYVRNRAKAEEMRRREIQCAACGRTFRSAEPHAKFCCTNCRVAAHRGRTRDVTQCNAETALRNADATPCNGTHYPSLPINTPTHSPHAGARVASFDQADTAAGGSPRTATEVELALESDPPAPDAELGWDQAECADALPPSHPFDDDVPRHPVPARRPPDGPEAFVDSLIRDSTHPRVLSFNSSDRSVLVEICRKHGQDVCRACLDEALDANHGSGAHKPSRYLRSIAPSVASRVAAARAGSVNGTVGTHHPPNGRVKTSMAERARLRAIEARTL